MYDFLAPADEGEEGGSLPRGLSVREFRRRRGWTLARLAVKTGLSKGHLSRFERGEKSLSVAALMRVAQALGASVSTLLGEDIDDDAVHLVRREDRKLRDAPDADGGYAFANLSRAKSHSSSVAFVVDIPEQGRSVASSYHSGEEFLFVVEGRIEIRFPGRAISMAKGDFLQFPGHLKHIVRGLAPRSQILVLIAI